jgi:acyl dehydratase
MLGKYFDELNVGEEFVSHRRTVTETDIVLFTSLTGLLNPLFTDDLFAREKGLGTRVAPGPLTLCYAIGLTDELVYRTVSAVLSVNNVKFSIPVKAGDTIWVKTKIIDKRESASKADRGTGTLYQEVFNQHEEVVCTYERTLMFLKRPS